MRIDVQRTANSLPPPNVPVIVAGGTAMIRGNGMWYSGMEEPLYKRPLQWLPKWWARIPQDNE